MELVKFMKKILKFIWNLLQILIILYVFLITLFIVKRNNYGYTEIFNYQFSVVDKSNIGNIKNSKLGDLVIVKKNTSIKVGDKIYYYGVKNQKYVVCEGVISSIEGDKKDKLYVLEGEENISLVSLRILGKKAIFLPHFGSLLKVLESHMGFLFFVLLPIMIIFIYQIFQLFVQVKYDEVDEKE